MRVQRRLQVLLVILVSLVLGHSSETSPARGAETCRRRRIVHTINSRHCIPRRLLSYACQGHCIAYTEVTANEFKRHCKCCQEMGEKTALVRMRCRQPGRKSLKVYAMPIKVPRDCMCRPCSQAPLHVMPQEMVDLGAKRRL